MTENEVASVVVDAAIEVHQTLGGPELLESVYEEALVYELEARGLDTVRQRSVPTFFHLCDSAPWRLCVFSSRRRWLYRETLGVEAR